MIERIWFGDSPADRAARALLSPLEMIYRGVVGVRSELYDRGVLEARHSSIPVISVGNVAVGGTGKTPISAWIAGQLARMRRSPAIVLRGYGNDEPEVHSRLNPHVPVIVAADRVRGIAEAKRAGADIAILDDGFQHRRAARDVDLVLLSADSWADHLHVLPAGPFREPLSSLERATMVIVTRKAATDVAVRSAVEAAQRYSKGRPVAVARLFLDQIVNASGPGAIDDVSRLQGKSVLAIAAIGNPSAFYAQLECAGAHVTAAAYPDHHAFTAAEGAALASRSADFDYAICTLKDAVKLSRFWPVAERPLWYVSLAVSIEQGQEELTRILTNLSRPHGN